jgi:hypothetical protein|tara:strand:- start:2705 stop:3091 length:387 start_codon:yes stop_codon:yes gene_type:complete
MEKKTYTLKIEITSSLFPNHPHLAVAVAKRMWEVGRDTQSISNQIGTDGETIQKIARLEGWKRKERNSLDGWRGYWGPFLTTEEQSELPETDFTGTDDPRAVQREEPYRGKIATTRSASSSLTLNDYI